MQSQLKTRIAPAIVSALALGAAATVHHQLFRRPLPKTSGRVLVRGLEAPVNVVRDRFGVPHIEARAASDACFGIGFCHGQDRLWQLEFFRRATAGRLSEFAGAETLSADRLMRTLGLRRVAARETEAISPVLRSLLSAYAAGINAAIEAARALPVEFQILRIDAEPWTVTDLLASSKLMAFGLSTNWEMELLRAQLVREVGPERAARLEPQYPRGNPIVTTPGSAFPGGGADLVTQIARVKDALGLTLPATGSNNWVVSGERSATGTPLLACDPHLTMTIPDLWYQADIACDEFHVRGATLPTNPLPVFGQTRHAAWGFTNVMADTQDLFVERLDPGNRGSYEFEGAWRTAEVVREEITVRGRAQPEALEVTVTHHGPIVNEALGAAGEEPLALSWTGLHHPCVSEAGYRSALARSGEEIVAATAIHTVPPLNMLWADAQGNIGYQLAGKIPLRRGGVADMPRPGWSGEFEWEGTVPFEDLPQLVNPPAGFIVTANNRIVGDDHPHHITSEWMTGYRATRIEQMLGERERHSVADFERMQHDFVSLPGIETAHRLARLGGASQRARRAVERLRSWDGTLGPDSVAGSIYQAFTVEFARAVIVAATADEALVERYLNKSALALFDVVSSPWRFQERLLSLWEEGNPDWFATAARPQGRSWDEVALESLERGLDALERRFGRDPDGWRWGRVHPVEFQHPMGTVNPILRRVFNRSVEAGGASETVTQNGYLPTDPFRCVWGPVYRMIADLGDPGRSRWQLTTGQSGHPASPHYDDMIDGWLHGHTHPVHAGEREARAAGGAHTLRLDPD